MFSAGGAFEPSIVVTNVHINVGIHRIFMKMMFLLNPV